jgi:hypothetical protein
MATNNHKCRDRLSLLRHHTRLYMPILSLSGKKTSSSALVQTLNQAVMFTMLGPRLRFTLDLNIWTTPSVVWSVSPTALHISPYVPSICRAVKQLTPSVSSIFRVSSPACLSSFKSSEEFKKATMHISKVLIIVRPSYVRVSVHSWMGDIPTETIIITLICTTLAVTCHNLLSVRRKIRLCLVIRFQRILSVLYPCMYQRSMAYPSTLTGPTMDKSFSF